MAEIKFNLFSYWGFVVLLVLAEISSGEKVQLGGLVSTYVLSTAAYLILNFVISYTMLPYVEMGIIVVSPAQHPSPLQFQRWS